MAVACIYPKWFSRSKFLKFKVLEKFKGFSRGFQGDINIQGYFQVFNNTLFYQFFSEIWHEVQGAISLHFHAYLSCFLSFFPKIFLPFSLYYDPPFYLYQDFISPTTPTIIAQKSIMTLKKIKFDVTKRFLNEISSFVTFIDRLAHP